MVVAIESRKRKCHSYVPIGRISYAPIANIDRSRIDYLIIRFSPFPTQVEIVIDSYIIHNWIIEDGDDEFIIPKNEELSIITHQISSY
jgi:hypothetical protein